MTDETKFIEETDELEDDQLLYEHFRLVVDAGQAPLRIDKYILEHQQHTTRNRIQKAADAGFIHVKLNQKTFPLTSFMKTTN